MIFYSIVFLVLMVGLFYVLMRVDAVCVKAYFDSLEQIPVIDDEIENYFNAVMVQREKVNK